MGFAVRVEDDYVWLVCRYVSEGDPVVPGMPLLAVVRPSGIQETICSEGWGVVGHVEGKLPLGSAANDRSFNSDVAANDSSFDSHAQEYPCADDASDLLCFNKGLGSVFKKNDGLCYILKRYDRGTKTADLRPRPGPSVRLRRELGTGPAMR